MGITMQRLAQALLHCSADLGGGRSMESLLRCLEVDPADQEKSELAQAEVRRLSPNIDDYFGGNGTGSSPRTFAKATNPYPAGTVVHHLWASMMSGKWFDRTALYAFVQPYLPAESTQASAVFTHAVKVVTDPWNTENGGRSFLRQTRDQRGTRLYRLEFSVPKYVMEMCTQAFGQLPAPVDPPLPVRKDDMGWKLRGHTPSDQGQQDARR